MAWKRFIKFIDDKDQVRLGDPLVESAEELLEALKNGSLKADELIGQDFTTATATGKIVNVKKLIGPLTPKDVPIIRCVGLNYARHSMSPGCIGLQHEL